LWPKGIAHHRFALFLEAGEVQLTTSIGEPFRVRYQSAQPADIGLIILRALPVGLGAEQEGNVTPVEALSSAEPSFTAPPR
jgi:hypothetical protein